MGGHYRAPAIGARPAEANSTIPKVNGFAQRFAELRSFAAKDLRSVENNRERMLATTGLLLERADEAMRGHR